MKRRILRKSEVLREGYVKGLRKAYRVISEKIEGEQTDLYQNNPFNDTVEQDGLSQDEQCLIDAYLEVFEAEDTLSETLEAARERYCGQFDSWTDWVKDEYWEGGGYITSEDLVDEDCVNWEKAGKIFSKNREIPQNGSRGQFDSLTDWVKDEYWEGGGYITSEDLVDEDCVNWEKAGKIFSEDYRMTQNGMVFRIND